MAEVSWIKLNVNIFSDEKVRLIRKLPSGNDVILVFVALLSQAGKCNLDGYIAINKDIPVNDEMFAALFDFTVDQVRYAFKILKQFKMLEEDEHNHFLITNWERHQNIEGMEKVRKQNAERAKKCRERKKQQLLAHTEEKSNVTVTLHNATEEEQEEDKEEDKDIEKNKNNKEPIVVENPFSFYQYNFGVLSAYLGDDIKYCISDTSEILVIEAMKRALENNKPFAYAKTIIKSWKQKGYKTLDQVQADDVSFNKRKGVVKDGSSSNGDEFDFN